MNRFLPTILTLIIVLTLVITGCGGGNPGEIPPISEMTFNMVAVSGGLSFPTDHDYLPMVYGDETADNSYGGMNSGSPNLHMTVPHAYYIAQTDVTYKQWSTVYTWATTTAANKYTFDHAGSVGSSGSGDPLQPVTMVSWSDAIVWCNALTEYYNANNGTNYGCVYTSNGAIVRNSNEDCSNVTAVSTAKGFRLPTNNEWELAARYIGATAPTIAPLLNDTLQSPSGFYWTPGNYVSGATGNDTSATAAVAVCLTEPTVTSTATVASKSPNVLGLYDMSGNVWKMCFDAFPGTTFYRVLRGGCYGSPPSDVQIGKMSQCSLNSTSYDIGFRTVRTQ